ncbi:hypothetical protein [Streptomyces sp. GS7]|uniref:hypothetical protein n=1 Tax=Streptomyces sp. GS7 TaxID=2692234 RepID=UPI001F1B439F|nr:hypothetical protein [Streptomyces sp. GS7]
MKKPLKTATNTALALAALPLTALALAAPAHADDGVMPKVSGKGLVSAYQALDYSTHVQLKDGRGTSRHVLWPGSWKVCEQQPAPGARLGHQKITLTVVKTHEQCGTHATG